MTRLTALKLVSAALPLATACVPPHFSVAVARGPTHVTYARRSAYGTRSDYLVDCALAPDDQPATCDVVPLEKVRR
jgi:hypothetical protein